MAWRDKVAAAPRAIQAFILKQWLPLCFLVATLIALTAPAPGKAVASVVVLGDVHLIQTINIIIVFTISGLVLRTQDIKQALVCWPAALYGVVAILGITPCLGFALRELPLTPPEFAIGLTIFAAVPTTLGVGEALVRASKGNAAVALLLLVGTNALGIATMPPWLKALLSNVDGLHVSVNALPLFYKLLVTVLAPACVGKAARELIPPVGRFATKYKMQLGMFSTVQLALIIWQTLSGAQAVLVSQKFLDIFIVICAAIIMHAVYLVANFAFTLYALRMPLREAIAASIMSSQKSAPVAVTVISYLTSNVTQQGLLAVPCIVGQLAQIFMGAAFAPHLARVVTRREKLAALAAPALEPPDVEAGPGAGDGGDSGKDASGGGSDVTPQEECAQGKAGSEVVSCGAELEMHMAAPAGAASGPAAEVGGAGSGDAAALAESASSRAQPAVQQK